MIRIEQIKQCFRVTYQCLKTRTLGTTKKKDIFQVETIDVLLPYLMPRLGIKGSGPTEEEVCNMNSMLI